MKPLYTQEEYDSAKGIDKLPLECYACESTFYRMKKHIKYVKPKTSQKYLDIITNIIDMKINNSKNNINILA